MDMKEFIAKMDEPITAVVTIGNLKIQLKRKHFTKRQIKHIKKYFGFDVENIEQEKE